MNSCFLLLLDSGTFVIYNYMVECINL